MHRVKGLTGVVLAAVLSCCLFAMPAWAFPALTTRDGQTSADLSDDGRDYGWLYRIGDTFYAVEDYPNTEPFGQYAKVVYAAYPGEDPCYFRATEFYLGDGKSLAMDSEPFRNLSSNWKLYPNGTLVYQGTPGLNLQCVIDSGTTDYQCNTTSYQPRNPASVKRVVLDESVLSRWGNPGETREFLLGLVEQFAGYENLRAIEGVDQLWTGNVQSLAGAFSGCASLEELPIANFETGKCADFTGMLAGCTSLVRLELGDGWTQENAEESKRATFPNAMTCEQTGKAFAVGDIIPNGAGTYVATDRTSLAGAEAALSLGGTSASAGETLTCEYTGKAVKPAVTLELDGTPLTKNVDFTVQYRSATEDGQAQAVVTGIGSYYGRMVLPYLIQDTGAYAFLFENGLLCLKAGHARPSSSLVSIDAPLAATYRWFDAATPDPGATVPWAGKAAQVKRIVVDPSFAQFAPVTAAGWFSGCTRLTRVEGLGDIGGSALTSTAGMFEGCTSLAQLDLGQLDTSHVTDFSRMVAGCTALATLNLGAMDASKAKRATGFYEGCTALTTLKTAAGWRNAKTGLAFAKPAWRVSPRFQKLAKGTAVPAGAGEYRLQSVPMQSTTITLPKSAYDCTGKAIRPKPVVKLGSEKLVEGSDYTVKYEDNIYPGTAKVTITGKGAFTGGLVAEFAIRPAITKAGDRVTYEDKQAEFQLTVLSVQEEGGSVKSATATVTKVTVSSAKTAKLTIPASCTIGGVKVTITAVSSKLTGKFRNVKTIVVGPKVVSIGAKAFAKATKAKTLVVKSARIAKATNCLKGSKITKVQVHVYLSKAKRAKYQTWFTKKSGKKNVKYTYG